MRDVYCSTACRASVIMSSTTASSQVDAIRQYCFAWASEIGSDAGGVVTRSVVLMGFIPRIYLISLSGLAQVTPVSSNSPQIADCAESRTAQAPPCYEPTVWQAPIPDQFGFRASNP